MTEFIDGLVAKIDFELAPIKAEIEQLKVAREALINGTEPESTPKPEPPAPANSRSRPAAKAAVIPAGKLVAALRASGGLSSADLAKATGGAVAQLRDLLRALEKEGQVRREGHARGLRWLLVTEEERVARRAAEIEERMRQPKRERPHMARGRARRS